MFEVQIDPNIYLKKFTPGKYRWVKQKRIFRYELSNSICAGKIDSDD